MIEQRTAKLVLEVSAEQRSVSGAHPVGSYSPKVVDSEWAWRAENGFSHATSFLSQQVRDRNRRHLAVVRTDALYWDRSSGFQWNGGTPTPTIDTCGWQLAPLTTLTAEPTEVRGLTVLTDRFDAGTLIFPVADAAYAWLEGELESEFRVAPVSVATSTLDTLIEPLV